MNLDSSGALNQQLVFRLLYQDSLSGSSFSFKLGDGKGEISYELLIQVLNYAKNGKKDDNSFASIMATAMYNGYSEEEQRLIALIESDREGLTSARMLTSLESEELDTSILERMPTQSYLNSMKHQEEVDFKNRELKKYYFQMDKIRGILPMHEMMNEFKGTSTQLSNFHITDMERLNDLKVHSPVF